MFLSSEVLRVFSSWEKVGGDGELGVFVLLHCVSYRHRMTCTRRMYATS